jgi:hypothetical protein
LLKLEKEWGKVSLLKNEFTSSPVFLFQVVSGRF